MKPILRTIAHQPSWVVRSSDVELAVTQLGGHMAPVSFYHQSSAPVQPYYINPWHADCQRIDEPVLVPLRGDFFCLPFGAACRYRAEDCRTHGEPAGARWRLLAATKAAGVTTLTLAMKTRLPLGRITKRLSLVDGHNAVYVQHTLAGFSGRFPLGHHATLAMPAEPRTVHVATSPIRFGTTNPTPPGDPGQGAYYCLAVNRQFQHLSRVPTILANEPFADCSAFPTRKGFCDQLAVFHKPEVFPAWTTATFEKQGFLWFSLKDAAVLPALMMWVENHGRHPAPWSGRNCCLGLEDVCGFLAEGLAASLRPNTLSKAGIPTAVALSPGAPTIVNYIQGVVKVPPGFKKVKSVSLDCEKVKFVSVTGKKVSAPVRHEFLKTGRL